LIISNAQVVPVSGIKVRPVRAVHFSMLLRRALEANAVIVGSKVVWRCSGRCASPVWIQYVPRDESNGNRGRSMILDHYVKCRKCTECQNERRRLWYKRAVIEYEGSSRTWFATFTLKPELQTQLLYTADRDSRKWMLGPLDSLPEKRRFELLLYAAGGIIGAYFRSLRKQGHNLRYLVVAEKHKSGLPHWHGLIHETGSPIPKRVLQEHWPHGFTLMKLVDDHKACGYVVKYLTKETGARVRCSLSYGRRPISRLSDSDAGGDRDGA